MDRYRLKPHTRVDLSQWDPDDKRAFDGSRGQAKEGLAKLNERLGALQELLFAESEHKVLVVLQAMDTGGKDGVIRHVFEGVNPQGVKVASFKAPTPEELAHDYLWRIHKHTPAKGQIVIFNRSHYEDVLVVRVHQLVPERVWKGRYAHINNFERTLVEEGTTLLKFYLHIDKAEQRRRLHDRLNEPDKRWKLRLQDLNERKLWPAYMKAYEDVLTQTSTEWAPWYIVPSNRKWYRNLVVGTVIVEALEKLNMRYPQPEEGLEGLVIE